MDEMYEYMNKKMDEMRKNNGTTITVDFHDFAKMYELVCFMRQIRRIVNEGERKNPA